MAERKDPLKGSSSKAVVSSNEEDTVTGLRTHVTHDVALSFPRSQHFIDITHFSPKLQTKLVFGLIPPTVFLLLKDGKHVLELFKKTTFGIRFPDGLQLFSLSSIGRTAGGKIEAPNRCIGAIAQPNDESSDRIASLVNFCSSLSSKSLIISADDQGIFRDVIQNLATMRSVEMRERKAASTPALKLLVGPYPKVIISIEEKKVPIQPLLPFTSRPGQLTIFFGPFPGIIDRVSGRSIHRITVIDKDIIRFISSALGSWCFLETRLPKIDTFGVDFIVPVFVSDVTSLEYSIKSLDSPCLSFSPVPDLARRNHQRVYDSNASSSKDVKAWQALDVINAGKILLEMAMRFTPSYTRSLENLIMLKPFDKLPYIKTPDGQTVLSTETATAPLCLHNSSSEIFLKGLARTAILILFGDKNTQFTASIGAALSFQARSSDFLRDRGSISVSQDFLSVTFLRGVPFVRPNRILHSPDEAEIGLGNESSIRIMASRCQDSTVSIPLPLHDYITESPHLVRTSTSLDSELKSHVRAGETVDFPLVLAISDSMSLRPHIIVMRQNFTLPIMDEMIGCLPFTDFKTILTNLVSYRSEKLSWLDLAHAWAHLCPSKPFILCPEKDYLEMFDTMLHSETPGSTSFQYRTKHSSTPMRLSDAEFTSLCTTPSRVGVFFTTNKPYLEISENFTISRYLIYIPPLNDVDMKTFYEGDPNHLFRSDGSHPPWIQRLEHFKTVMVTSADDLSSVLSSEHSRSKSLSLEGSGSRTPLSPLNSLNDHNVDVLQRKTFRFKKEDLDSAIESGSFITDDIPEPQIFSISGPLLIPASQSILKSFIEAKIHFREWKAYYSSIIRLVPTVPHLHSLSSLTAENIIKWDASGNVPSTIFSSRDSELLPPFFRPVIHVLLFESKEDIAHFRSSKLFREIHSKHFATGFNRLEYQNPTIVLTTALDDRELREYITFTVTDLNSPELSDFIALAFKTTLPRSVFFLPPNILMTERLKSIFSDRYVPMILKDEVPIFLSPTSFKLVPALNPDRCTVSDGQRIRLIDASAPKGTTPPIDCIIQRSGLARDFLDSSAPTIERRSFPKRNTQSIYISFSTQGVNSSVDLESFMAVGSSTLSLSTTGGFEKWGYDKFSSMYLRDVRQKASDFLEGVPSVFWFYHALAIYLRFCRFTFMRIPPVLFIEAIIESDSEKTPAGRSLSHLLLKLAAYFIKYDINPKTFTLERAGTARSKKGHARKGGAATVESAGEDSKRRDALEHANGFFNASIKAHTNIQTAYPDPIKGVVLPSKTFDCIIVFFAPIDNALSFLKPWSRAGIQGISVRPTPEELDHIVRTATKPLYVITTPPKTERARIFSGSRLNGTPFRIVAPNLHCDNVSGDIFEAIASRIVQIRTSQDDRDLDAKMRESTIELADESVVVKPKKVVKGPQGRRLRDLIDEKLDCLSSDPTFIAEFEPIITLVKQFSTIGDHLSPPSILRNKHITPLTDALDVLKQNTARFESKTFAIPFLSVEHFDFISTKLADSDRAVSFDMDAWAYQALFNSTLKPSFKKTTTIRTTARMDLQTYIGRKGLRSKQFGLLLASLVRLGERKESSALNSPFKTWQAIAGSAAFISILRDTMMVSGIQSKKGTIMHPFAPNLFHEMGGDLSVMMQPTFNQPFSASAQVARGGEKPQGVDFNLLQNLIRREAVLTPFAGDLVADGNMNPHALAQPSVESKISSGIFKCQSTVDLRDPNSRSVSVETCFLDIFPTLRQDAPFIWGESAFDVDEKSLSRVMTTRIFEKVNSLQPLTRILLSYILTLDFKMTKVNSPYFSIVSRTMTKVKFSQASSGMRQPSGYILHETFNPSNFVEIARSSDPRIIGGSLTAKGCFLDSLFVGGLSLLLSNTSSGYTNAAKTAQYRTAGLPVWHRLFSMMPASSGSYFMYLEVVRTMLRQIQTTAGEGYVAGRDVMSRNLGARQSRPTTVLEQNSDRAFADIANNSSSAGGKIHIDTGKIRKVNYADDVGRRIELKVLSGTKAKAVVMTTLATVSEKQHSILFGLQRTKDSASISLWSKDVATLISFSDFEAGSKWAKRPNSVNTDPDIVSKTSPVVITEILEKVRREKPSLALLFQCSPMGKRISYSLFLTLSSALDISSERKICAFCGLLFGRSHDFAHVPYGFMHIQEEVRAALIPSNAPSCVPRVTAGSAKVRVAYIAGTSWMMFADHKGIIEQFLWLAPEILIRNRASFSDSIEILQSTNSLAKFNSSSSLLLGPSIFEPSGINNVPGRGMTTKTAAIGVALRQLMWASCNNINRDLLLQKSDRSTTKGVISILSTVDFRSWDTSLGMVMAMMRWVTEEINRPELRTPSVLALITYLDNLVSQFYSDRTVGGLTYSIVGLFPVGSLTFPVDFLPSGLPITAVVGSLHHVLICTFEKLLYAKLFSIRKDEMTAITVVDVATVFASMTKHASRPHGEIVSLSQYGVTDTLLEELAFILNTVNVSYDFERDAIPNSGYCSDDSSSALSFTPNVFIDESTHQYWTFLLSRLTFIGKVSYQFFGCKVNPDDNMASTRGIVYLKMTFAGALFGRIPTSVDHENENFSDQTLSLDEKMNVSLSLGGSNLFSTRNGMLPTKFSFAGRTTHIETRPDILTVGDVPITMSARAMAGTVLLLRLARLAEGPISEKLSFTQLIEESVHQTTMIEEKSEYKASKLEGVGEIFDVGKKVAELKPKLRDFVRAEPIDPRFSTNFLLDFQKRGPNITGLQTLSASTGQRPLTIPLPFAFARHSPTFLDTASKRLLSTMTSRMSNSQQGALLASVLKKTKPIERVISHDSKNPHPKVTFGKFIIGTREYEAPRLNMISPALIADPNISGRIFAHKAPSKSTTHFCIVQTSISGHLWVFLAYGEHLLKWMVGPSLLPNSHFVSASLSGKFTGGAATNTISAPKGGCPMSLPEFASYADVYGPTLSPQLLGLETGTFEKMLLKAERYRQIEKLTKSCVTMKELMTSTAAPCGPCVNLFRDHSNRNDPPGIGLLESSMMSMLVYGDISNSIRFLADGTDRPNPFLITFLKFEPLIFTTLAGVILR